MAKTRANSNWYAPGMKDAWPRGVPRPCAEEGCDAVGDFPAPKSRDNLREFQWLCLDHVKVHNARWDFLKGLNPGQIEEFIRASTVGERPSWPTAAQGKAYEALLRARVLRDFAGHSGGAADPEVAAMMAGFTAEEIKACRTLGLAPTREFKTIKARYRKLAKQLHPDVNGHRKDEEKLKTINHAYSVLKTSFARN